MPGATAQEIVVKSPDGHPFRIYWECTSCGAIVQKSDRYCRMCGSELTE